MIVSNVKTEHDDAFHTTHFSSTVHILFLPFDTT
jgi:hypothetical protein